MVDFIVERYIYDALNARASLQEGQSEARSPFARKILSDIELYFADNMQDVQAARDRLATRTDEEGRKMFAFIEELMASHEDASRLAQHAIRKARRR